MGESKSWAELSKDEHDCLFDEPCSMEPYRICEVEQLRRDLKEARALLKELEWINYDDGVQDFCPSCQHHTPHSHAPDCRLAAFLSGGEEE